MRQVCNLGGGVASGTMFLKSLHDEIPEPCEAGIFADTGAEPQSTWDAIHFLKEYAESNFGVPVYIVSAGTNIIEDALKPEFKRADIPAYTIWKGKKKQTQRQCTNYYKQEPVWRLLRSEFEATHKTPVSSWLGYTTEEAFRMKPSRQKYEMMRYPLIEKRIYRYQCEKWLKDNGFPKFVKSACTICPFRKNHDWKLLTDAEHEAVSLFEDELQDRGSKVTGEIIPLRLHKSMTPIRERPFENPDQGELDLDDVCDGGSCWT